MILKLIQQRPVRPRGQPRTVLVNDKFDMIKATDLTWQCGVDREPLVAQMETWLEVTAIKVSR